MFKQKNLYLLNILIIYVQRKRKETLIKDKRYKKNESNSCFHSRPIILQKAGFHSRLCFDNM
ncbi:hypothetical protein BpHYR1_021059 [Brachionus plicatilis]|uniref:Uncharacterized protein n=1 Tax=Brachionus plicatilis TaxID=10195 RepID=A0A3M7PI72_BRAPC|nr:hypothetical protein BpHYR1_021059 [Brachionus plicatilis]